MESVARSGPARDTLGPIEPDLVTALQAAGYDLEAIELTPAGKRRVLRIAVDKDGGITLDDVAEATRLINDVLDTTTVLGEQPYTLEVTSRGVDRPLTLERHWRRNISRLVKVTLLEGGVVTGRIISADDAAAILEEDVKGRKSRQEVAYADVAKAVIQIEFTQRRSNDVEES
ncbi:ribosome maturation factor RimP [Nocardioides baekrokdamisoli]|uniref:Ribosome maturation factor RimP n=1 Tax=Nocardioides baekrokdamisoli TaxID=1804624 RepID=A0A3G9IGW6_9ACTN|nr:ribosome maturation factor RimP [Nocardioides baekrokdamisoli]BBH18247.1 ribosome maturation factor RimP [Nocardioides baekrokdamisoli]